MAWQCELTVDIVFYVCVLLKKGTTGKPAELQSPELEIKGRFQEEEKKTAPKKQILWHARNTGTCAYFHNGFGAQVPAFFMRKSVVKTLSVLRN